MEEMAQIPWVSYNLSSKVMLETVPLRQQGVLSLPAGGGDGDGDGGGGGDAGGACWW